MRQAIFIGKLFGKSELGYTPAGTPVLSLTLQVLERQGESWADNRFRLTCFGKQAERIHRQAKEGSEIVAVVKPECREFNDKNGKKTKRDGYTVTWIRICLSEDAENDEPIPAPGPSL